ncbi:DUF4276 family protein [Methylomonas sp. EFPC3]|uniref:DUF4276 family protein n=1 Tax=Methylomonas sp. EFPC3 TaxID=3021710 RepID=UPI002417380C|nr:DUF4276 family protein [Methylomonas sp. EFPC3]WFP49149.1 DUF4276 family protein [Methylomonas sp. EFPC3]
MIRMFVVCEGQTEETFVRDVIAPILANQQVYLIPRLIPTSKGHKGGGLNYQRVKRFIINCLKEDSNAVVTTFFDLYALDSEFPCFQESQRIMDVQERAKKLENEFKLDLFKDNELFADRFIPHIQPYEFEGLLFSDVEKIIELETDWKRYLSALQLVRSEFPSPEHINNSYETKPSARLKSILKQPTYGKVRHGSLAIKSIGIDKLCEQCQHFSEWYTKLNQFGILAY